jgi:alpha-D-ribose 1-methylphosphonate 5-phosphate C-P lyase
MAYGYGLTGIAVVKSASTVGSGVIRVFDVCMADTSAATALIRVFNGITSSSTVMPAFHVSAALQHFNSNAGIRLENGCFVWADGCTAIVNYIQEL